MDRQPVLVVGYGNPSRGDDAAGPAVVERLEGLRSRGCLPRCFDTVSPFQLQIELAELMLGRAMVIFVDAGIAVVKPFVESPVAAMRDRSYTSHELSPSALLEVQQRAFASNPGRCIQLAIRAKRFGMGQSMSAPTLRGVAAATRRAGDLIRDYARCHPASDGPAPACRLAVNDLC